MGGPAGECLRRVVLAVAVRAAGLVATAARPLSISCQFLRPAKVGLPIEATVVSMRRGRTNELLAVTLEQAGKTVTEAHVRAVDGARDRRSTPSGALRWWIRSPFR